MLHMGYAEDEKDIWRYQGREMHLVLVDEAARMTPLQLNVLRAWNRKGSWKPAPGFEHVFPRIVFASNPGGVGHEFLKETFVSAAPAETIFFDKGMADPKNPLDRGWPSIYIPAKMADNAYLDPNYAGQFQGMPREMARALVEGDWDAIPGAALELLEKGRHQLRPFTPPRHWTHFMSIDWGTARPFSVGWFCVSDGALLEGRDGWPSRYLPAGAVIMYREWYGWNGKSNEGSRMPSQQVAAGIKERELAGGDPPMKFRVGDSQMWAQADGPSVVDRFIEHDIMLTPSKKDRKAGYAEIRARLAGNPRFIEDGRTEDTPMLFATANCQHFWRTLKSLTLDEIEPDKGPDTKLEDHIYDMVVYALRQRPFVTTKEMAWEEEMGVGTLTRGPVDWYATS